MFDNLKAEMARNGLSGAHMASVMHITKQSFYKKMSGASDFNLKQMESAQRQLKLMSPDKKDNYTLDYLFKP